jgi:hypothetical protein
MIAQFGAAITGISTKPTECIVHFADTPTEQNLIDAQAIVTAHDPVFLTVDKLTLIPDESDTVLISVSAPKTGAAAVTLVIGMDEVAVTMADGAGSVELTALDAGTIDVTVKTGTNRNNETLRLVAVNA